MKQIIILTALLFICGYGYEQEVVLPTVIYKGSPAPGTIAIAIKGYGSNAFLSSKDGISSAFYRLLFRGIPGSQYDLPMIPDEAEKKNSSIVRDLLAGGYKSFLLESTIVNEGKKKKKTDGTKGVTTDNQLIINCDALRRYLEQHKMIRKFGI